MTYLTAQQLGERLNYNTRYVNNVLRTECFTEGRHYIRPFGRRRILYIWEAIEEDMFDTASVESAVGIPMANGGVCHG